ncbi:MAG: B12-binding domain-containing radical SAM protein [Xanthomonadales bacterium]|nr:radical SAM protein [Gammaproteobacteria bacterium]MBT8052518.1 radical SAM protein [Gammaproteobacteria bacterium]NND57108.1 B12-binding domain-containing radical SAM protein [Xanthomonadales bacterium]NNK52758.1 B12-binding domain-containing radical SAM protein [Xanthomonadales bacterium]
MQLPHIEPVFRPPSEARSLILQVTNGCSWNQCTFCEMYTQEQKRFHLKKQSQIEQELKAVSGTGMPVRRIFLADGDAMTLSFRRLKQIMDAIQHYLPDVQRVSSYCLPRNLKHKTVAELSELGALGLNLFYVGCESGDDLVLEKVKKGETFDSSLAALQKIKSSGSRSSVMILNGMGGKLYSEQHAVNSARLMNRAQPEYLSTLVVSFPAGTERYQSGFKGEFEPLDQAGLFREMRCLLDSLELKNTIFRSDHASNYLVLKGTLNRDKSRLLQTVQAALEQPGAVSLRPEWMRGL